MASWWDAVPAIAGAVGKIAGNSAKGSADQRAVENNSAAQRNALLAQLYSIQQNATQNALTASSSEKLAQGNQDLNRREFALNAPSARGRQAVKGSIMANAQDATLSGVPDRIASRIPTINGGLRPSLFDANTRQLGSEMTRDAIMDQLAGDNFDTMTPTDFKSGILSSPQLEEFQKSGLLEKILGGLGVGGSLLGSLEGMGRKKTDAEEDLENADNPYVSMGAG